MYKEALNEAMKRYPNAVEALVWYTGALGLNSAEPSKQALDWFARYLEARKFD